MISHNNLDYNPKPKEEISFAFGKYLIDTTCKGCHGPELRGGKIAGGDPKWPPATALTKEGLGNWTEADLFFQELNSG